MTPSVYINGRFLNQSVTGVQRFSVEITAAIDRLIDRGEWPTSILLAPRRTAPDGRAIAQYRRLTLREIGRTRGHLWEQAELPGAARGGILVSLGNTAPILCGRRQVVVIHDAGVFDTPESYSPRFRAWYKLLQHGLRRTGARIVTVSRFSRDRIVERLGVDAADVTVICEGADHILRVAPDPATLRRHGLEAGKFALVVSNRVAHKNIAALREAAVALGRRGMVLAVAGDFYPGAFRATGDDGILERRLGRTTDAELRALYESAACLLFPSRYEGFGLPPVEAMACGCPVLAYGGGAVEEICGDSALYFTDCDGPAITATLERLLDEPRLAAALRARGREQVAGLRWDAAALALADVVRHVQSGPPREDTAPPVHPPPRRDRERPVMPLAHTTAHPAEPALEAGAR
jgi:glycosyltransferase involved in cell wall biosynthesis